MTITASRLRAVLQTVTKATKPSKHFASLNHCRIESDRYGRIRATANDLDVAIRIAEIGGRASRFDFAESATYLETRDLLGVTTGIWKANHDASINLADDGAVSAPGVSARVSAITADEFQDIDWTHGGKVEQSVTFSHEGYRHASFVESLGIVETCVDDAESRFCLHSMLIQPDTEGDYWHIVATDGHRLAARKEQSTESLGELKSFLLPASIARAILAICPTKKAHQLTIDVSETMVSCTTEISGLQINIAAKRETGTFPDWQQVWPKDLDICLKVDHADLISALETLKSATGKPSERHRACVAIDISTDLTATFSTGFENGRASCTKKLLSSNPTNLWGPIKVGGSWSYLRDAAAAYSDNSITDIKLKVNQDGEVRSAILLNDEYLLMPMRLS